MEGAHENILLAHEDASPKSDATAHGEGDSFSPSSRTSSAATLVDEFVPASGRNLSSEVEEKDTGDSESHKITETLASTHLNTPSPPPTLKLHVKKRVTFADPLPRPSNMDSEECEAYPDCPVSVSGQIDDDFDLSERTKTYKATRFSGIQRKLDKKKSSLFRRSTSSSSSSNMPLLPKDPDQQISPSTGSGSTMVDNTCDSADIATTTLAISPTATTNTDTIIPPTPLSDLPNAHQALESLINIHLSKLSRLKNQVLALNTQIETLQTELRSPDSRAHPHLLVLLEREITETRAARDAKRVYVDFHRRELARIVEKRWKLDEEAGVEWRVPLWWESMEGEEDWDRRFW
jgi:hypothetical protein